MKKWLLFIAISCLNIIGLRASQVYTVENLPNIHLSDKTRYVCDPEGILDAAARDSIDALLYRLETETGIETVVAVVPSIGEKDCYEFSRDLFNGWGVGKKSNNNGLVVLLVIDQRRIEMRTGYGLEGYLPDAICKRIQINQMVPYFKDGNWSQGMWEGMKAVYNRLEGSMEYEEEEGNDNALLLLVFLFSIGLFVMMIVVARKAGTCPKCGKYGLTQAGTRQLYKRDGIRAEEITFVCPHCGHTIKRRHTSYDSDYHDRGGGPIIFGGGGFGGGFGGGPIGGSFGGGMTGGGGAGTSF